MLSLGSQIACGSLEAKYDIRCKGDVFCNHVFADGDHTTSGDTSTNLIQCSEVDCSGDIACTHLISSASVTADNIQGTNGSIGTLNGTTINATTVSSTHVGISNVLNINELQFTVSSNGGLQITKNFDIYLVSFRYDGVKNSTQEGIFQLQWTAGQYVAPFAAGDKVFLRNADGYETISAQFLNTTVFTVFTISEVARTMYVTFPLTDYDPYVAQTAALPVGALPPKSVSGWSARKTHIRTLDMASKASTIGFALQTIP